MSRTLWLDCSAGASGNMILAALVDLGCEREWLESQLLNLSLKGWTLSWQTVLRGGIRALHLDVQCPDDTVHRSWSSIRALLENSCLAEKTIERCLNVFCRLAEAEARIHDCDPEEVVFHEVGGVDAIIDIVGVCLALERLNVDEVIVSSLGVGEGSVTCAHGPLPLPAPATVALIRDWMVHPVRIQRECLTPTGAALVTTLGQQVERRSGRVLQSGYGAGSRADGPRANIVRAILLEHRTRPSQETLVELTANIDDMTSEQLAYVVRLALDSGALDAWICAAVMKKGRPGHVIHVLSNSSHSDELQRLLLRHSTTLGVRRSEVTRQSLERQFQTVHTTYGPVQVKVVGEDGEIWRAAPEFDDCERLARLNGVPIGEIFRQAMAAWSDRGDLE